MTVRLRIDITAGWADCELTLDEATATVTASYLSDGIGDLAASVASTLRGAPDSTFTFAEEPGEYHWTLRRVDTDRIRVTIGVQRNGSRKSRVCFGRPPVPHLAVGESSL